MIRLRYVLPVLLGVVGERNILGRRRDPIFGAALREVLSGGTVCDMGHSRQAASAAGPVKRRPAPARASAASPAGSW
jgi:hypothetical protein